MFSGLDSLDEATLDASVFASLPIGSVAYPVLRPDEQSFAFAQGDRVTLADVRAFLDGKGAHSELRAAFGLADSRQRLRHALDVFQNQFHEWLEGHRQSPQADWLVPAGSDTEGLIRALYRALLDSDDYATFIGIHELLRLPNAPRWTPFVSAASLRIARSVRRAHRIRLERAFRRGADSLGLTSAWRPWTSEHPLVNALPTSWLYQFQPTQQLGALIERAYRARLFNVGHLAILDPAVTNVCSSRTIKAVRAAVSVRMELGS